MYDDNHDVIFAEVIMNTIIIETRICNVTCSTYIGKYKYFLVFIAATGDCQPVLFNFWRQSALFQPMLNA